MALRECLGKPKRSSKKKYIITHSKSDSLVDMVPVDSLDHSTDLGPAVLSLLNIASEPTKF